MEIALFILTCLGACFAAGASDFLETRYVRAVKDGDAEKAARSSILMMLAGAFCLYALVDVSVWVLVPEAAGMYVGTKLAMR